VGDPPNASDRAPLRRVETDASGANLIATQDAVILGRRSYDEWAEFWPGSEIQPFASFINAVPKYVATSTPLEREWANSRVIDGGWSISCGT
jgi:dihydrofolate reductase